jgi:ribosomal-protein-alanine N-acetyltransferase
MTTSVALEYAWMTEADVPALVALERASGMEEIWSVEQFRYLITSRQEGCRVARREGSPLGYAAFRTDDREPIVLSVAVAPGQRRQGLGRRLLDDLLSLSYFRQKASARTYVRESSLPVQLFLKACGWRCEGIRPGAFDCPPEDAYLFRRQTASG